MRRVQVVVVEGAQHVAEEQVAPAEVELVGLGALRVSGCSISAAPPG